MTSTRAALSGKTEHELTESLLDAALRCVEVNNHYVFNGIESALGEEFLRRNIPASDWLKAGSTYFGDLICSRENGILDFDDRIGDGLSCEEMELEVLGVPVQGVDEYGFTLTHYLCQHDRFVSEITAMGLGVSVESMDKVVSFFSADFYRSDNVQSRTGMHYLLERLGSDSACEEGFLELDDVASFMQDYFERFEGPGPVDADGYSVCEMIPLLGAQEGLELLLEASEEWVEPDARLTSQSLKCLAQAAYPPLKMTELLDRMALPPYKRCEGPVGDHFAKRAVELLNRPDKKISPELSSMLQACAWFIRNRPEQIPSLTEDAEAIRKMQDRLDARSKEDPAMEDVLMVIHGQALSSGTDYFHAEASAPSMM